MNMHERFKFGLRGVRGSDLFFGSLLSVLLFVSLFSCLLMVGAAVPLEVGHVESETELVAAVNDAALSGEPVIISISKNIDLSAPLLIPADANVTLVSMGNGNFNLSGASGESTVIVEADGILRLDGVIVTHASGKSGCGVQVESEGTFVLLSGMVFNNTVSGGGAGVTNYGDFILSGGEVSNNTVAGVGGAVLNYGTFTMSGGVISNNTISGEEGGGVFNNGTFTMSGGLLFGNAYCGVFNGGNFVMSGGKNFNNLGSGVVVDYNGIFVMSNGEIYKNSATSGGGVYIDSSHGEGGNFTMTGGIIYNNTVIELGGGVCNIGSTFKMTGGAISNNTANNNGGGVYSNGGNIALSGGATISNNTAHSGGGVFNNLGNFVMSDGEISNNTARTGGGAYTNGGRFYVSGGKISKNTATLNGGGIGVPSAQGLYYVYINGTVTFSDNHAATASERDPQHDDLYKSRIMGKITWTGKFTQGYNNYDILYLNSSSTDGGNGPGSKPGNDPSISPKPTNTANDLPGTSGPGLGPINTWSVTIIITLIICLAIATIVLYQSKKKTQPAEDWINSHPVQPVPTEFSVEHL